MIGRLSGEIVALGEDALVLDVAGVGYLVQAGAKTLAQLQIGDRIVLWVETRVREDAITLFGFTSEEDRAWFVHLQSVPNVGGKVALAILDVLSPPEILEAAALEDKSAFKRANGVGPTLAARLAQELKGKTPPRGFLVSRLLAGGAASGSVQPGINPSAASAGSSSAVPPAGSPASPIRADAVSALVNLGLEPVFATRAVANALRQLGSDAPFDALVKAALTDGRGGQ